MPYSPTHTLGLAFECLLACLLALWAAADTRPGRALRIAALRAARRAPRNDLILLASAFLLPLLLRLLLLAADPPPAPIDMEEHNHLLQAQTYALGRLANPVHPLAVLLQSFQTVSWPHVVSARPLLPAIFLVPFLALSWPVFAGNLLAAGLASAALCWMFLGWMPRLWAIIGSLIVVLTFCLFGYWVNAYWCPATTVIGAALLLGLVPRVAAAPLWRHGLLAVPALALLAFTRPYENAIYAAVVLLWLAARLLLPARRPALRAAIPRFGIPLLIGVAAIALIQLGANHAATGNIRLMPYTIWRHAQETTPSFLWQRSAYHPVFFNASAQRFAAWEAGVVAPVEQGGPRAILLLLARHTVTLRDVLGPFLVLPLLWREPRRLPWRKSRTALALSCCCVVLLLYLGWGWAGAAIKILLLAALVLRWRHEDDRLPILLILSGLLASTLTSFYMSIYVTALTAPLLLLALQGLRRMAAASLPAARSLAGILLLGLLLMPVLETAALLLGQPLNGSAMSHLDRRDPNPHAEAEARLAGLPGRHAILLRTKDNLPTDPVWLDPIWNAPDPDNAPIVWLRDLRPDWTAAAINYYQGRHFWLMVLDNRGQFTLSPYAEPLPAPAPLATLPQPDKETALSLGAKDTQTVTAR